ncbi:hypothetical protein NP493_3g01046 [Ridgeia piscesae]|uniref:Uncharacterized protein n=1 Tax=Ridgeia piscesae TaxID=27915 RepID=A0AAD9PFZ7_RIDPI|nr:hypothetical protein NP493_3g01046 [Ridgeia piscesae]
MAKSMERLTQEGGQEVGGGDTEEVIKLPSVAERIIQMESRKSLDKDKLPISMTASPTLAVSRAQSGPTSPSHRHSPPKSELTVTIDIPISPVTADDQMLLDRLSSVAEARDAAAQRKRKFQRNRDTWRRQTQPVTCNEVSQADKLDSVAAFRAEIQKKTSLNVFKQLQQQSQQQPGKGHIVKKVKGQETYPEPLQRERLRERQKNPRYKTLPVSLRELGNIVEMESLKTQRSVPDDQPVEVEVEMTFVADDPQTDEDFDTLVEINAQELTEEQSEEMLSFTFTLDVPVGDKCEMSVGDKLSMFRRLDEEAPKTTEMPKKTTQSSHAKSLLDRRKRLLRHRTLPVTDDEVMQASVLATGESNQVQTDQSASEKETASGSDDELSKMSLAEKVKLFSMKKAEEEKEVVKSVGPRRRPRRMQSRFRTQSAEIEVGKTCSVSRAGSDVWFNVFL